MERLTTFSYQKTCFFSKLKELAIKINNHVFFQFVEIEKILSEVDDTCFGMYSCVLHEVFIWYAYVATQCT